MKNRKRSSVVMAVLVSLVMLLSGSIVSADNQRTMSPELAAKKETVRKQHEQRVTHQQKQTAANALKAERLKVYQAKQAVKKSQPLKLENN